MVKLKNKILNYINIIKKEKNKNNDIYNDDSEKSFKLFLSLIELKIYPDIISINEEGCFYIRYGKFHKNINIEMKILELFFIENNFIEYRIVYKHLDNLISIRSKISINNFKSIFYNYKNFKLNDKIINLLEDIIYYE